MGDVLDFFLRIDFNKGIRDLKEGFVWIWMFGEERI